MTRTFRSRTLPLGLAIALIPVGLATRGGSGWLDDHAGGIVYVLFWCFAARVIWPGSRALWVAVSVLAGTCVVEGLQLWHPPWLESIRATPFGSVLLGSSFDALDFAHYIGAAAVGYLALRRLEHPIEV